MPRYWVIAPYDVTKPQIWEKVWQFDLSKHVIAIGWKKLGDISSLNQEQLHNLVEERYPQGQKTYIFNVMWNFWHNVSIGDKIIARKGTTRIASVGEVTKTAFYDEIKGQCRVGKMTDDFYSNFIGVEWDQQKQDIQFEKAIFGLQTMYEIKESKFNDLIKGITSPDEEECEAVIEKNEFIMEKYLEEFILSNFDSIFKKKLKLYVDSEGNIARQYPTDIGTIDILAEEIKTNTLVVIELKKGRESDKVIGQLLRYMGWINDNLKNENQKVKGMIICKEPDQKLLYAIKMVKDIEVKYYKIDFKLSD